ncbi:MAG: DUF5677 domain-containing protein [Sedimentisphaerales bacterium]
MNIDEATGTYYTDCIIVVLHHTNIKTVSDLMKILQDMLDTTIREQFSIEKMGIKVIERRFEELGIKLTDTQRKELSIALGKGDIDSFSLSIEDDQIPTELLAMNPPKHGRITLDIGDTDPVITEIADQFLDQFTEAIPEMATDIGAIITSDLRKKAKRMLRIRRKNTRRFESDITDHWESAFDLLDTMIVIASEAGGDFNKEIRKSPPLGKGYLIEATTRLHARACQVSSEVLTLLKGGYADGAHARWRCLHEIAVVLFFLASGEDETAERYLLHEAIESHKAALSYQEHCDCLGYEPMTQDELTQMKQTKDVLIARFGKSFAGDYGWAEGALKKKYPTFRDIECSVEMSHMRPLYKMASHNVHANPKGIFFKLCLHSKNSGVLPIGPSMFGLADPGHGTAISILQATTTLLTIEPNMDCLVVYDILRRFANEAEEAFMKAHESLEKDIACNKSVNRT